MRKKKGGGVSDSLKKGLFTPQRFIIRNRWSVVWLAPPSIRRNFSFVYLSFPRKNFKYRLHAQPLNTFKNLVQISAMICR